MQRLKYRGDPYREFSESPGRNALFSSEHLPRLLQGCLEKRLPDVAKYWNERPGIIAEEVQKWVNNVEKETNVLAKAGRPSALSEEQRVTSKVWFKKLISRQFLRFLSCYKTCFCRRTLMKNYYQNIQRNALSATNNKRNALNQVKKKEMQHKSCHIVLLSPEIEKQRVAQFTEAGRLWC